MASLNVLLVRFLSLFCLILSFASASEDDAQESALSALGAGHVVLLRHANAPGVGDPPGMRLDDCSTQRNLDERGRDQARRLGERFRAAGLGSSKVFTSQWCRCRETAKLLGLGEVADLPALNSFFGNADEEQPTLAALRAFLEKLPKRGPLVILVTHQVTITALTGEVPASGNGVVLELLDEGGYSVGASLNLLND